MAVIVGPNCASACEFFAHDMTRQGRADIIGQYPTAGAGGSRVLFLMPGPEGLLIPVGRPLDAEGNIIIEGTGVAPTIRVPVSEETLFSEDDVLLNTAIALLSDEDLPYGAGSNTETGKPIMFTAPVGATEGAVPAASEAMTTTEAPDAEATATPEATAETTAVTATEELTTTDRVTVTLGTPGSTEPAPAAEAITATEEVTGGDGSHRNRAGRRGYR